MTVVPMEHLPIGPDARVAHDSGRVLLRVPEGHLCRAKDLHRFFWQTAPRWRRSRTDRKWPARSRMCRQGSS
eukprot:11185289-Lingulodinium_polyedra.AAC.1